VLTLSAALVGNSCLSLPLLRSATLRHCPFEMNMHLVVNWLDSVVYTVLGFMVPLYWTCKALLRHFTSSAVASRDRVSAAADEAEVPVSPASSTDMFTPIGVAVSEGKGALSAPGPVAGETVANWLYYWCILSALHLALGVYGVLFVPLFGPSTLVRVGKLVLLGWLGGSPDARAARWTWHVVIGPVVAKHEADVDVLIRVAGYKAANYAAIAISKAKMLMHSFASKKVKSA
jgi:hypothetical protein